jgi:hypothetical protein
MSSDSSSNASSTGSTKRRGSKGHSGSRPRGGHGAPPHDPPLDVWFREELGLTAAISREYATLLTDKGGVDRLSFLRDAQYAPADLIGLGIRRAHVPTILARLQVSYERERSELPSSPA